MLIRLYGCETNESKQWIGLRRANYDTPGKDDKALPEWGEM